jgi:hypothetical protein
MLHDVLVRNLIILIFVSVYPIYLAGCFRAYFIEIKRVLIYSRKKSRKLLIVYAILSVLYL